MLLKLTKLPSCIRTHRKPLKILEISDSRKLQVLCASYTRQIIKDSLTDLEMPMLSLNMTNLLKIMSGDVNWTKLMV